MAVYPNIYNHTMTFKNPKHRTALASVAVQSRIDKEVAALNDYYRDATPRQVSNKKYLTISYGCGHMDITLETEHSLPNPARKGQCMRQLSVHLLRAGFGSYLTDSKPHKLLSA